MPYNLSLSRDSSVGEILSSIKEIVEENTAKHFAPQGQGINTKSALDFLNPSVQDPDASVREAMAALEQQIGAYPPKIVEPTSKAEEMPVASIAETSVEISDTLFAKVIEETRAQLRVVVAKWVQENLPSLLKDVMHEEIALSLKNIIK